MELYNLPKAQSEIVDAGENSVKGVENFSPVNTFRYNVDKEQLILIKLGISLDELVNKYLIDSSTLVYFNQQTNP